MNFTVRLAEVLICILWGVPSWAQTLSYHRGGAWYEVKQTKASLQFFSNGMDLELERKPCNKKVFADFWVDVMKNFKRLPKSKQRPADNVAHIQFNDGYAILSPLVRQSAKFFDNVTQEFFLLRRQGSESCK